MGVFSVMETVSRFTESLNRPPVSLVPDVCVHARYDGASCEACMAACPTDALTVQGGKVVLASDYCVGCGACVHRCPTGALHGTKDADKLLRHVSERVDEDDPIELTCAYRPGPLMQHDRQADLYAMPGCLAALSISTYVELANVGVCRVTLRLDACADCPIGSVASAIQATAQRATSLMAASSPQMQINVTTASPKRRAKPTVAQDVNRRVISRRGLFQLFSAAPRPEPAAADVTTRPSPLPRERQRLLDALQQRSASPPWAPSLTLTGDCTACEVCANICPMGALTTERDDTQFRLAFRAGICTACGLCADACPPGVIALGDEPSSDDANPVALVTGELHQCSRCRAYFLGEASSLCPACAFRRANPFGSYIPNGVDR